MEVEATGSVDLPVTGNEYILKSLGDEFHLLCLELEDGLPIHIADAEGSTGYGILCHGLEPLRHVNLYFVGALRRPSLQHLQHALCYIGHQHLRSPMN